MKIKPWTTLVTAALSAVISAGAQENYSTWAHSQPITVNTTTSGANVTNTVANFPLLVRLTSANADVFSQAASGGADIRFTSSNGTTRLKHQKERWDSAARAAEFWVLAPSIAGNAFTTLRMYWGKPGAADSSNGNAVFDTSNAFSAVWHMNKRDTSSELDATINSFTLSSPAAEAARPTNKDTGAIGPARSFDGTNSFMVALNTASSNLNFQMTDSYTLSAWINPTAVNSSSSSGNALFNKGDNQWTLAGYADLWEIQTRGNDAYMQCTGPNATASIGAWHHLVGTYTGAPQDGAIAETLYYDGTMAGTYANTNTNTTGRNLNFNVFVGTMIAGTAPGTTTTGTKSRYYSGYLDEIVISRTARSSDWVALSYATQRPGQTAVTVGTVGIMSLPSVNGFGVHVSGSSVVFRLPPGLASGARITVTDVWGRTMWSQTVGAGTGELSWNGKSGGKIAAHGIYFARLTTEAGGKSRVLAESKIPMLP